MADYRAPGLYVEPVVVPDRSVHPLRTDIAGFVGLAPRGPAGVAVAVTSRELADQVFGRPVAGLYLGHALRAFFLAGGRLAYVVRVTTEETVEADLDLMRGSAVALRVVADSPGAWANGMVVTVTRARLGTARATAWAPNGEWAEVDDAGGFGLGSLVEFTGGAVVAAPAVVAAVDGKRLTWRDPVRPRPAAGGILRTCEFNLRLQLDSKAHEFRFLGTDEEHPRFYEKALREGSAQVRLEPGPTAVDAAARYPDDQRGHLKDGADGLKILTADHFRAGLEVLSGVPDVSIVAVPDVAARAAKVLPPPAPYVPPPPPPPKAAPVCGCPGEPEEPPPARLKPPPVTETTAAGDYLLDARAQESVREALIEHCEQMKDRFAIVDPPPGLDPQGAMAWREGLDSKFAAVYYPWLLTSDPSGPTGATIWVPPSGHLAGIYAATDLATGPHRAPANTAIPGLLALAWDLTEAEVGRLNPLGLNALRLVPGAGARVWGARTLSSDASWRYVPVRRLMIMIERAIVEATPWAVFEPHTVKLRFQIVNTISTFLQDLWRGGALAGTTPEEAFFVKCDDETNPADTVDAGMIVTEVGVAPVHPAEFVIVRVERARDAVQVREVAIT